MDDNHIELMRSTVDCYDRMKANGGNVPDGFMLEFRSRQSAWMRDTFGVPTTFVDGHYYRLVPVQPPQPTYVPFTWEDRAALRGRWIRSRAELAEIAVAGLRRAGIVVDGTVCVMASPARYPRLRRHRPAGRQTGGATAEPRHVLKGIE